MTRAYNFGAGPAMLPESVLQKASSQMLEYGDTGTSIMELGHRTGVFQEMLLKLEVKLRDGKELALAIKQVLGNNASTSKQLGLIREAMFYKIFAKDVKA